MGCFKKICALTPGKRATLKNILSQKGFTMIEVVVVCAMLGILAAIAVPKLTSSIDLANTAKVKTDLQTLDAAIVMYEAENGATPDTLDDLKDYVVDIDNLAPPKGTCYMKDLRWLFHFWLFCAALPCP